jgi:hypothetical protein
MLFNIKVLLISLCALNCSIAFADPVTFPVPATDFSDGHGPVQPYKPKSSIPVPAGYDNYVCQVDNPSTWVNQCQIVSVQLCIPSSSCSRKPLYTLCPAAHSTDIKSINIQLNNPDTQTKIAMISTVAVYEESIAPAQDLSITCSLSN